MRRLTMFVIALMAAFMLMAVSVDAATASKKSAGVRKSTSASRKSVGKAKVKCRTVCRPVRHRRVATVAKVRSGAGPAVVRQPVINVPQQPAPVVNVDATAPVVNVAAPPPGVGITTDQCFIYVVQGDQLLVIDKATMCITKRTTLSSSP